MDEDLIRGYGRWRAAEVARREAEADAAFKAAFGAVPVHEAPVEFTAATMAALARASQADVQRTRWSRAALVAAGVAGGALALFFGAGLIASAASAAIVGFIDLMVGVVVTAASAMDRGAGFWSVLGSLGRAGAAFLADPKVTVTLLVVQGVAAMALFALQRLLGSDGESFK